MNKTKSIFILIILFILTISSTYFISKLKFNYDFESYFPAQDDDLEYLLKFRKRYENDTDFLVIGLKNNAGVFNKPFLSKVTKLTENLKKIPGIIKVTSITNIKFPVVGPGGFIEVPLIHFQHPERWKNDSIYIFKNLQIKENFISLDGKSILILISNTQNIKKKPGDLLLNQVEKLVNNYHFNEVHVAGKIKASIVYVSKMQSELLIFMSISTLLIATFLFIAYRSLWGIIIPLTTVIVAIIITLGIMGMIGKDIDLLTSLLPPILFVVAMSDMTHFISKYLEELRSGHPKLQSLNTALKDVGLATFITALTTAVGFITLINSSIAPIRDFGFYTAIGVFVSYGLAFSMVPALLTLMKEPAISKISNESAFWHSNLQKLLIWIFRNKFFVVNGSITIILISIFFISKIEVNSTILDDISDRDPLKKSVRFIEENFGGIRPFEMSFSLKNPQGDILNYKELVELDKIENYLINTYQVNNLISPLTLVKLFNQALHGGNTEFNKLPDADEYDQMKKKIKTFSKRKEFKAYLNKENNEARISGKMGDIGSTIVEKKDIAFKSFLANKTDTSRYNYRITGSALLIDKNNKYLAASLIEDLIFGIISIAVIIGFLFKSFRMVILALIPNLIPLLVIGGIMGLFGINLKASTSIIFSIAFGIAVDDSIHFLSRFKMELQQGKHFLYALKTTYISTGKAMVVTSLILISGFASLLLSTFEGTFYTGLLISLTLIIAIIADLILLPVLLILFFKPLPIKVPIIKTTALKEENLL